MSMVLQIGKMKSSTTSICFLMLPPPRVGPGLSLKQKKRKERKRSVVFNVTFSSMDGTKF